MVERYVSCVYYLSYDSHLLTPALSPFPLRIKLTEQMTFIVRSTLGSFPHKKRRKSILSPGNLGTRPEARSDDTLPQPHADLPTTSNNRGVQDRRGYRPEHVLWGGKTDTPASDRGEFYYEDHKGVFGRGVCILGWVGVACE